MIDPTDRQFASSQEAIAYECELLKTRLLAKNTKHCNRALDPVCVLSRATPADQIRAQIDAKIASLARSSLDDTEELVLDLLSYLILLRVAEHRQSKQ